MIRPLVIGTAIATLCAVDQVAAQAMLADSTARMERVAEGVYAIVHDDATEDWPHSNVGVIVGDDAVLVIDSDYYPSRARADIALIRRVTDRPVRYLVNTHWHGDHTHGNSVYRDSFPGLMIVSQRENRETIELNQLRWPRSATAPGSATHKALARVEATLAGGKDSAGRALSAEQMRALRRNVDQRRAELRELATVVVAPPNVLFDGDLALDLGGRMVELHNWGRANSPADVTVYLPAERVLFTGDILVHPLPYVGGSFPGPWIGVLQRIETVPVTAVVPGHGLVQRDHAYTRRVRELLQATRTRIDTLFRQGKTLAEVQTLVSLDDLRAGFPDATGQPFPPEVWTQVSTTLVERMSQCVNGYRC